MIKCYNELSKQINRKFIMNITELLLNAGMTISNEPVEARDPNDYSVSDMFYEENNDILAEDFDDYY